MYVDLAIERSDLLENGARKCQSAVVHNAVCGQQANVEQERVRPNPTRRPVEVEGLK